MNTIVLNNIRNGSHTYRLWATLFRHSFVRLVLASCRQTALDVFDGSQIIIFIRTRFWPLFLVGDYLDRPLELDSTTLESSFFWGRLRTVVTLTANWFRSLPESRILVNSISLNKFRDIGQGNFKSAHRLATVIALLFLAVYYFFRIILQVWLPTAHYRAGWLAGLALALLIAASLKISSKR